VYVPAGEVYLQVGRFMEELAATQWRALLKLRLVTRPGKENSVLFKQNHLIYTT
jgi:hypothetical protein